MFTRLYFCVLPVLLASCATPPVAPPPALISRVEAPRPASAPPPMVSRIEAHRPTTVSPPRRSPQETTLALEVFFAPRILKLSAKQEANLDSFAGLVLRNGNITVVTIDGHADEPGTDKYRLALAGQRAESLKRLLLLRGVPVDKVTTQALLAPTWEAPKGCIGKSPAAARKIPDCVSPGTSAKVSVKTTTTD